jgi:hypothetical protein
MKAYGGGVNLGPLIVNGELGFGEWSVEFINFSTPGERAAGIINLLAPEFDI